MPLVRIPLFLALAVIAHGVAPAMQTADDSAVRELDEVRALVVERINRDRSAQGLKPLEYSPELSRAADAHCAEMLRENYTSHWNRAGWKPYLRYSHAGIRDNTAENVASYWCTGCNFGLTQLRAEALRAHQSFMNERPPNDGHRQAVLDASHTHVGIGLAFGPNGFRMIELFAGRYVELDPLPNNTTLSKNFRVTGRLKAKGIELMSISVFYEPLPRPMSKQELQQTYSYSLPDEERIERPSLAGTFRKYTDGSLGTVEMGAGGAFQVPLTFWKQQPGVYTVAVWVRKSNGRAFIGGTASVIVER